MKRLITAAFMIATIALTLGATNLLAAGADPLAHLDFSIVGVELAAGPEYQAVPKGIATVVDASFRAGDFDVTEIIDIATGPAGVIAILGSISKNTKGFSLTLGG